MKRSLLLAAMTATLLAVPAGSAIAQKVLTHEEADKMVSIKDLKATASSVTGVVVNNTPHIIRDIEIAIEYHWMWANEFKPGPVAPGRAVTIRLDKELRPGESTTFRYVPDPPLENRKDGQYDIEAVVAGFTSVIPATTTAR
jgi:hypothetical protein